MEVTLITSTNSYNGLITSGSHPDYTFTNTFEGVVVTNDESVTCKLMPSSVEESEKAYAYVQPLLTHKPRIIDINKTEMIVSWDTWDGQVDYGDGPIEKYEVYFKMTGNDEFRQAGTTNQKTTYKMEGLFPFTNYTFAVKTHRPDVGGGGDLGPPVVGQTLCDLPLGSPVLQEVNPLSSSTIEVIWKVDAVDLEADILQCDSVTSYTIHHRDNGTGEHYGTKIADPTETSAVIYSLQSSTAYEISVTMENRVGSGPFSDSLLTTTLDKSESGTTSTVIIVSAVCFSLAVGLLILILLLCYCSRRKNKPPKEAAAQNYAVVPDPSPYAVPNADKHSTPQYENVSALGLNQAHHSSHSNSVGLYANVQFERKAFPRSSSIGSPPPRPLSKGSLPPRCMTVVSPKVFSEISETADGYSHLKPIKVVDLVDYIKWKKKSNGDKNSFKEEYKLLPTGQTAAWNASQTTVNRPKNRFKNICAYDHSRVVLQKQGDDPNSDYINANYISGYKNTKAYIATQGPKKHTVDDLWRMIWEEKCVSILMATKCMENNKEKCIQYWPKRDEEPITYGNLCVKNVREEVFNDWVIRKFHLKNENEGKTREIRHFQFTSWPDMKVPQYPSAVLAFLRNVNKYTQPDAGPLIIHCSAGVGRTGTFITIDAMLQMAEAEEQVDIFNFVLQGRRERINFVQTAEQYEFIYSAVLEATLCGITAIPTHDLRQKLHKMKQKDALTGKSALEIEFDNLAKLCHEPSPDTCNVGLRSENENKNRYPHIVPIDKYRPLLMTCVEKEEATDYINASYVTSYKRTDAFLATQMPMEHTIIDFWRMVYDYKTGTIIMLNDMERMI
ncbi:receptor-type tyrosine-protein phosphatase T-like [Ptychodera flava]|uniref:receptor-type tyrosine-protein phosphatase T-like n=1 Tax=Ptychodera flava TaxID=63121 RepID=UPI00396A1164